MTLGNCRGIIKHEENPVVQVVSNVGMASSMSIYVIPCIRSYDPYHLMTPVILFDTCTLIIYIIYAKRFTNT